MNQDGKSEQLEPPSLSNPDIQNQKPATQDVESATPLRNEELYHDPTPKTPRQGISPTRKGSREDESTDESGPAAEIQSIMDQFSLDFSNESSKTVQSDVKANPNVVFPARSSSLEQKASDNSPHSASFDVEPALTQPIVSDGPQPPTSTPPSSDLHQLTHSSTTDDKISVTPAPPINISKLPPAPDPEPDLPFDFHRFLEQLRHRTADPVAKYLRSFLFEFGRKQWAVQEQVKLISDFLSFITNKMARCEVWRGVSDAEFDNAKEGMEKLVMNRLYAQTFSPAIPNPQINIGTKNKKRSNERPTELGREGQHQEDVERDEVLAQKVKIYGWVEEEHLDIPPVSQSGRRFLVLAQQELLKIKTYRAPRDKIICVLNCCKVIFGILRNSKTSDTSADSFVPLLIYVVLHANPDHLVSNVQYILRFRNPEKLNGEAGYYLSSLMGAIQFIENIDRTSLTISDEEFENKVEAAVSAIAEKHQAETLQPRLQTAAPYNTPHISEKSGLSQPEIAHQNSIGAEYSSPGRSSSLQRAASDQASRREDNTAVGGLLRTIQKPLANLGRVFQEELDVNSSPTTSQAPPKLSPTIFQPPPDSNRVINPNERVMLTRSHTDAHASMKRRLSAEEAAASQASAEAAEAHRIQRAEHENIVDTLAGMFPNLDKDVIDDVVRQKQGRVGLAVDACLALND